MGWEEKQEVGGGLKRECATRTRKVAGIRRNPNHRPREIFEIEIKVKTENHDGAAKSIMAPIKRFADSEGSAFKKEKHTADDRASKRQKKLESSNDKHKSKTTSQSVVASTKSQKAPQPSVFKDEERAFPRGGASVLTPLEHKQIMIEATQDVLFEQAGNKRPGKSAESDDGVGGEIEATPRTGKKTKKAKGSRKVAIPEIEEARIRTEGLSYKVSVPALHFTRIV